MFWDVAKLNRTLGEYEMNSIWFQQVSSHSFGYVQSFLKKILPNGFINLNVPMSWPTRPPNLTPLDFYLKGSTKAEVFGFGILEIIEILENTVRDVLSSLNANSLRYICFQKLSNVRWPMKSFVVLTFYIRSVRMIICGVFM